MIKEGWYDMFPDRIQRKDQDEANHHIVRVHTKMASQMLQMEIRAALGIREGVAEVNLEARWMIHSDWGNYQTPRLSDCT
jgi:hypothetical protein